MYNIDLRGGPWWSSNAPTKYGKVVEDRDQWPGPAYHSGSPNYKLGAHVTRVHRPSEFLMFVDSEASGDVLNSNYSNSGQFASSMAQSDSGALVYGRIAFRHSKKSSTVYADGHVKLSAPIYENYQRSKMYFAHQE